MGSYIAILVATFAPFAVALIPVGSKEKIGRHKKLVGYSETGEMIWQ